MNSSFADMSNYKDQNAGGKANQLFRLRDKGFPVPELFCVTGAYLRELEIQSGEGVFEPLPAFDPEDEESVKAAVFKLTRRFQDRHLTEALKLKISETLASFPSEWRFSVRSSSNVEDGGRDSFAGQFETFLHVSADEVTQKVLACFASMYSPRVLKYCHAKGIPVDSMSMSVIVQRMIPSEYSGVAFSAHPKGLLNEAVVTVGRGTGDGVVEDKVPVTSYYFNRDAGAYYYEAAPGAPLLPEKLLFEILEMTSAIGKDFHGRADIEYAIYQEKIWLLQARPITTIADRREIILDNSNIVESYPGVSLPLTASFVKEAYAGVFKNLLEIVLPWKGGIDPYIDIFSDMVRDVNGRMYYDINNWYTLIQCLPMREKIIPVWQEMLGVQNKEYTLSKKAGPLRQARAYLSVLWHFLRVPTDMKELENSFSGVSSYFDKSLSEAKDPESLEAIYNGLSERILQKWGITLLNDLYAFVFAGLLKAYLKRIRVSDAETVANSHISGILNIESMKPVRSLDELARLAREKNIVEALRLIADQEEMIPSLDALDSSFSRAFLEHIRLYGDRAPEELKMESRTFRTDPKRLLRAILDRVDAAVGGPADRADAGQPDSFTKAEPVNELSAVIPKNHFLRRRFVLFLGKQARLGIENREISRLNRSRIYGMVRTLFLEMGKKYQEAGILDDVRDVFYLRLDELMPSKDTAEIDRKKIVAARKQEYQTYEKLPSYSRLIFAGGIFNKHHISVNSEMIDCPDGEIRGIPCSNGTVTGEVLVVHDPQTVTNYQDKILVTRMTDPGWVFLLSVAKGIIAEKGSLLSHTAIVSRELKIPSIVGAPGATRVLTTGDIVTMNGNTGEILLVKKRDAYA
jgi:pyruvate,water dikinase